MQEEDKILKVVTRIFIAIFIVIFITIMIRFLAKNVLVDMMNIDNTIVHTIAGDDEKNDLVQIGWDKEYPIESFKTNDIESKTLNNNLIEKYNGVINKIEKQLEKYSSDFLFKYEKIVEIAKKYEKIINWNLITLNDVNTPIYIQDGYWSIVNTKEDYGNEAKNIIEFYNYLNERDIDLIYIQAPKKTQDYKDGMFNIYTDYSDENIDNLINELKENKINVLDLREKIREDKIEPRTLFFKTDHHWTPQATIWAINHIVDKLNNDWNMNINKKLYKIENYYIINYNNSCLGSEGRKVTLAKADTEDFDIVLPNFKTNIEVTIPEKNIHNKVGDVWNTLFDKEKLKKRSYYDSSEYEAYGYGSVSLLHAKNNDAKDSERILLLADSFSGTLTPYLSLGVNDIYRLDLRKFDGSVKSFIEKNNITKVIMLYYPGIFQDNTGKQLLEYK